MEHTPATPASAPMQNPQSGMNMRMLVLFGAGLGLGWLIARYRSKKKCDADADKIAEEIANSFTELIDKAVKAGQNLPAFKEEWEKNLKAV